MHTNHGVVSAHQVECKGQQSEGDARRLNMPKLLSDRLLLS